MLDIRVQGYENQVKMFLVLLVLFLAVSGVVGLNVLYRSRALLMEEAEGRITSTSRAVQREVAESGLIDRLASAGSQPATVVEAMARLRDLTRTYSLATVEIVDMQGRVLAGAHPWRLGVIDPIAAGATSELAGSAAAGGVGKQIVIREAPDTATPAPEEDDEEYGRDRGEVMVFLPLTSEATGARLVLETAHQVIGVRTVARQIRLLAWTQAIAGLVVLALVFLFVRWVLRPYRALKETAARIEARGSGADLPGSVEPAELVSSFRGVIDKLEEQAGELERLRAAARPSGGPAAAGPAPGDEILSQEMLDGLTSGVLIIGPDGRIRQLNPAGETILGARERIVGHDYREVFASSPDLLGILAGGVEEGRARAREVVPYLPVGGGAAAVGGISHLGVTVSALPAASGPTGRGGAFCLFSDLTEIRGLQERVRLKENLAGLGSMSAGIAHEFRNSLATILGYARLITRQGESEHAAAIAREVQAIGRLVDEFLRYARPASIQATSWDPRAVMADVAREVTRDLGREGVIVTIGGNWPAAIRADEALLRQAFANLLRNAVEAIPVADGLVTVTGAMEDGGDQLRIEVADSGTGIPADLIDRLFTPFVTTKESGTGLGLALAQKAIICHDGVISARNGEAGGACFSITLPTQTRGAQV